MYRTGHFAHCIARAIARRWNKQGMNYSRFKKLSTQTAVLKTDSRGKVNTVVLGNINIIDLTLRVIAS
jgi:hypothetical protein